jgi:hypothetical protein
MELSSIYTNRKGKPFKDNRSGLDLEYYRQVGQLKVEFGWLKKSQQLDRGGTPFG